jgi:hypothetical protein
MFLGPYAPHLAQDGGERYHLMIIVQVFYEIQVPIWTTSLTSFERELSLEELRRRKG